ncbi:MAG TPA: helix-turn-helix domain-containing protein, partial [Candidatus Bathyarchaeia archaeon]|nr:helix-turn-helix domain-containing protein [Candidatus Bathyarchaeia archaeon]
MPESAHPSESSPKANLCRFHLSPKQKVKIVKKVLHNRLSVSSVCRDWGISRQSFYRWLRSYQSSQPKQRILALENKNCQGEDHWRRISANKERQLLELVSAKPKWSVHQLAKRFPSLSHHGIQSVLERYGMSTISKRLNYAKNYQSKQESSINRKLRVIRDYEKGKSVSRICLANNISRQTFYRWYQCYRKKPDQAYLVLKSRRSKGDNHWKKVGSEIEDKVLNLVVRNPDFSSHRIASVLSDIGNHGVQNVLKRHGLNTFNLRLAYSSAHQPAVTPALGVLDSLRKLFGRIPAISAIPPPALEYRFKRFQSLFGVFFLFFLSLTATSYLVFAWLDLLARAGSFSTQIGLVLATVSLAVGSFFFLYSMKYYLSLALVLSFSRESREGSSESEEKKLKSGQPGFLSLLSRIFGIRISLGERNNGSAQPVTASGILGGQRVIDSRRRLGLEPDLSQVTLQRFPFVSLHLPMYNEKRVAERLLKACSQIDYPSFEIIVVDDSTDETTAIVKQFADQWNSKLKAQNSKPHFKNQNRQTINNNSSNSSKPLIKLIHRDNRQGFKGGALREALKATHPQAEFIVVFDADFVPYPDTIQQ